VEVNSKAKLKRILFGVFKKQIFSALSYALSRKNTGIYSLEKVKLWVSGLRCTGPYQGRE